MPAALWVALLLICLPPVFAEPAKPLQKFGNRTLVPTDWADGDSFQIKTPADQKHTIRLYGVDCLELHVTTDSDANRLGVQRRYFGITGPPLKAQESIELAKSFGELAAKKTAAMLRKPFTVHTRFRDARGDGRYKRVYAFVTCADGKDLGAALVESGLARAFGVDSDTPDGKSADESAAMLADLELLAAKRGTGIWAKTDWEKLPVERQQQRKADEEVEIAIGKQPLPADFKLNPNTAARDELMKLPGIGEKRANHIISKRPYAKPGDLLEVPDIGPKRLEAILPYLEFPKP